MNVVPAWLTPRRGAVAAAGLIVALYLAALPGPLRLDVDSAALLRVGASLADGTGFHPPGSESLPPGYPVLVAALDRGGIAGPPGLMLLGLCALVTALVAARPALRLGLGLTPSETNAVVLLSLVSVYTIKYATLPLTELPFLAASALSVMAFVRFRAGGTPAWFLAGIATAGVACSIRTAGVALGLAAVLAFPSARARLAAVVLAGVACLAVVAVAPYYVQTLFDRLGEQGLDAIWSEPLRLVRTSGGVAANIPLSALERTLVYPVSVVAGIVILSVSAWALWSRRRSLGPVDGFVAATLVIVLLFPYEHPRFFLPLLPYGIGYCVLAARRLPRLGRAYAAGFASVGFAGLLASTALSYAGDDFPQRYAGGHLAPTYRVAWGLTREGDKAAVDERVLWALRRYDPDPPGFP